MTSESDDARGAEIVPRAEGVHRVQGEPTVHQAHGSRHGQGSAAVGPAPRGILAPERAREREEVIALLTRAYSMEIETVMSYLAASINLDGIRGRQIAACLADDVAEELGHARRFGERIKELYGVVPGSLELSFEQAALQPPEHQTDVERVIRGVIAAESAGIDHYNLIVGRTAEIDPVTADMATEILHDEERHRRRFEGYLREYDDRRSPGRGGDRSASDGGGDRSASGGGDRSAPGRHGDRSPSGGDGDRGAPGRHGDRGAAASVEGSSR
ncbi:MAG TPA: ferritin-like domain-containing protein [Solirubrobacteraceae bacterium]|nr:ferritin-like domain-containing protein [Solirubrobacteraceae bacterium]